MLYWFFVAACVVAVICFFAALVLAELVIDMLGLIASLWLGGNFSKKEAGAHDAER
jgi:hypothetical protein